MKRQRFQVGGQIDFSGMTGAYPRPGLTGIAPPQPAEIPPIDEGLRANLLAISQMGNPYGSEKPSGLVPGLIYSGYQGLIDQAAAQLSELDPVPGAEAESEANTGSNLGDRSELGQPGGLEEIVARYETSPQEPTGPTEAQPLGGYQTPSSLLQYLEHMRAKNAERFGEAEGMQYGGTATNWRGAPPQQMLPGPGKSLGPRPGGGRQQRRQQRQMQRRAQMRQGRGAPQQMRNQMMQQRQQAMARQQPPQEQMMQAQPFPPPQQEQMVQAQPFPNPQQQPPMMQPAVQPPMGGGIQPGPLPPGMGPGMQQGRAQQAQQAMGRFRGQQQQAQQAQTMAQQPGGGGGGGGMLGGPRIPPNLQGKMQAMRMQNRPAPGPGGNRIGGGDQRGVMARARQSQTGRPPISRRSAFPGRAR